jgi:hypothetical protein
MMRICFISLLLLVFTLKANAWGFWAHQRINRVSVFLLPPEMLVFYKQNIDYITEHSVDPDKRRYATPDEAPRHYIDLDHYCTLPCIEMPHRWEDAVAKYSEDTLKAYGIVPWRINSMMYWLTDAFKQKDYNKILRLSAEIGHYVGDAHVPLHTTENYNGQLTGQNGIHGFWESRIPELFGDSYDYFVGKADFIPKPLDRIWSVVMESHTALDSVLSFEKKLSMTFPSDRKYAFSAKGNVNTKLYSEEYTAAYSKMMDGMVERRMRQAIKTVADIWYTCWVNAGSPSLKSIETKPLTPEEDARLKEEEIAWKEKRIPQYGHVHPEKGDD